MGYESGCKIISKFLIENTMLLSAVDDSENSLLMHAVFNENAHIAELILNQGASPDVGNMLTKSNLFQCSIMT